MAQIILVKGTSIISSVIKKTTGSEYSHCGFLFGRTTVEADYGGVQVRDFEKYPWPFDIAEVDGMTWDKDYELYKWCLSHLGKPYDYGKVIGLYFELVYHWAGLRSFLDSENAFHCAEFVCEGLLAVGIELNTPPTIITPATVASDKLIQIKRTILPFSS